VEKLLKQSIISKLREWISNIEINPNDQSLKQFWMTLQWYEVFSISDNAHDTFIQIFQDTFFPKWLDVLYEWTSSDECDVGECMEWYTGWKQLFEEFPGVYESLFAEFNKALNILNTFVSRKIS